MFFIAQSLASWDHFIYGLLAAGLMWIWFALLPGKGRDWTRLGLVLLAGLVAMAVTFPFALPYLRAHEKLPNFERSLHDQGEGSARPIDYLKVLRENLI